MNELESILNRATDIAESASEIALSYFRQAILIEMKDNMTPVTVADKKTEENIRRELALSFTGFGICGEEFGDEGREQELVWTVDPIDGTKSFIKGIPLFGTLIGLLQHGTPIAGIMVLPALRETYTAAQGLGTFCNGHQIHVSQKSNVESSFISVGDVDCFEASGHTKALHRFMDRA
ncbi:MAG: inositol monophosphatase family protein, partial [Deltaproteobacteria bacterium]